MKLSEKITYERKRLGLTQDALAQKMGVSNQAVSKWESDLSCPDIMLLPLLADVFGITVDELFGREAKAKEVIKEVEVPSEIYKETSEENKVYIKDLPWEDDNTLHLVLYKILRAIYLLFHVKIPLITLNHIQLLNNLSF